LINDFEGKIAICQAELQEEKEAHAVTRKAGEVTLKEHREALQDIEGYDKICQRLQEERDFYKKEVDHFRSMHADSITERNAALRANDDLQDILKSKGNEIRELQRKVDTLERRHRQSLSLIEDEQTTTSNTERIAQTFKQQLVQEQAKVCDLQLQIAKLQDQLRSSSRRYSYLSECGDCDPGAFLEPYKSTPIPRDDSVFSDASSVHFVDIDCCEGTYGIEVAGLAVIRQITRDPTVYYQGHVQEGDIILKVNDVSIDSMMSEYANKLLVGEGGRLHLQVRRPSPVSGHILSRYTSDASGISAGMVPRKESAASPCFNTSSSCPKRKTCVLSALQESGMSNSLHSLPEAALSEVIESQPSARRKSVFKSGISITVLEPTEDSLGSLSKSLTSLSEASEGTDPPPQLQRRIHRRSRPQTYPMTSLTLQSLVSGCTISKQQQTVSPVLDVNGESEIRNVQSPASCRTVKVVASEFSPTVEVVGGYGRGIFVKKVYGDVTLGTVYKGDQILRLNGVDFTRVTRAQAAQVARGNAEMQVLHNQTGYEDTLESNFGDQDSFYVRTLFTYRRQGSDGIEFEPRTIFHVTETSVNGKTDFWVAYRVSKTGKDITPKMFIPEIQKASDMHQLEIKQNAKVNHKKPKEASAAKRKTAVTAQDHNRPHIGYELVKQCQVKTARPVMLLGVLTQRISDQLFMESSTIRFVKCQSTI
jgi:hypothetical protein